jgi:hypothetical protein
VYDDMWRMRCADPYLGSNFIFLPTPSECLSWIKNDLYPEYDYPNPADYI